MKTSVEAKMVIENLRGLINYHNDLYFQQQQPKISDEEFDQLVVELKKMEKEFPEHDDVNSPTHRIGGSPLLSQEQSKAISAETNWFVSADNNIEQVNLFESVDINDDINYVDYVENTFKNVLHSISMLSLGKSMSWEEFVKWFKDMVKKGVKCFTFEVKLDGLAISLLYKNYKLVRGATRGDGTNGDDITATIMKMPNIPKTIDLGGIVEVRGENIIFKSSLAKANIVKVENGEDPYKNVRNAASGVSRIKKPTKETSSLLNFGAYMLCQQQTNGESHSKDMSTLRNQGFTLAKDLAPSLDLVIENDNIDEYLVVIKDFFQKITTLRQDLDFDIDGIVIKCDNYNDQKMLGEKVDVPNWATAFKFESPKKMTTLLNVEWLLGAKGNITPRAIIEPTEIGGVTVSRATLHNINEIYRLGIKINDKSMIERKGDVIPKITNVYYELRTGNERDIEIPTVCPECGELVVSDGASIRCDNVNCSGRSFSKVMNFIKQLEIEDFGPKALEKLIEAEKIKDLSDIFSLTADDISPLERMGKKSAEKIIKNIDNSKKASLAKVIAGLTIKQVGEGTAKDLAKQFKTLSNFINIQDPMDLISIDNIGSVTTESVLTWINVPENKEVVQKLIDLGIGESLGEEVPLKDILNKKTFSFTGTLSIPRTEMEKKISQNGGIVSSIKKELDFLIVGAGAKEHKVEKAISLGAKVIKEDEFNTMIS